MESPESFNLSRENIVERKFCPGDLIFAKMKGYPTWPARVLSVVSEKWTCIRYSVFFYGTHNSAVCNEKNIFPYADTKAQYGKPLRYRGFQLALDEIQEAASLLEQSQDGDSSLPGTEEQDEKGSVPPPELTCLNEVATYNENYQSLEEDPLMHQEKKPHLSCSVKRERTLDFEEEDPLILQEEKPQVICKFKRERKLISEEDHLMHQERKHLASSRVKKGQKQEKTFPYKDIKVKIEMEEPPEHESLDIDEELSPAASWEGKEQQVVKEEPEQPSEKDSSTGMPRFPEDQYAVAKTCKIESISVWHSVQNISEETHTAKGELLKGHATDCGKSPHKNCNESVASRSCSERELKVEDGEEKEDPEEISAVGEKQSRTQAKVETCKKKMQCSSSKETASKQGGRLKRPKKSVHCDICGKCLRDTFVLKTHKRMHTGEKPFQCALCNKRCPTKGNLATHLKTHSEERPYKCSSCEKSFKMHSVLKIHMRGHSGEKPFKCRFCSKAFVQSGLLTMHVRVHTGERPFVCRECGRSFSQLSNLKRHIRLVHAVASSASHVTA